MDLTRSLGIPAGLPRPVPREKSAPLREKIALASRFVGIVGAVRETFFAQQVRGSGMHLNIPNRSDFLVDGRFLLEIGGQAKKRTRIRVAQQAYEVRDAIEVGFDRDNIPLWLFGFLC